LESSSPGWNSIQDFIEQFLTKIPRKLLASAAIKIGAYARGMRYLELEARSDHLLKAQSKDASHTVFDITLTGDTEEAVPATNSNNDQGKESVIPVMRWNDYANGVLPPLTVELIDFSMEIYAKLGDADASQVHFPPSLHRLPYMSPRESRNFAKFKVFPM
jgi:hypothetical protein